MKNWYYAVLVFLGGACLGLLSTFVKLGYIDGLSPGQLSGSQYLFGTILLWLIVSLSKDIRISSKQVSIIILAGIPMGLTGIFYYKSLQTLDASLAIIFLFQFIWIGTLIELILYKRKPTPQKIFAILIIMIGSVLAAGVINNGFTNISWQGTVWGISSAFTFSFFILLSGTVGNTVSPILKSALLATGSLLIVIIVFPPTFLLSTSTFVQVFPYGLILGLFGVTLPPLLFSIGMPHIGIGYGTILTASELPVAVILSAIVLKENITLFQWIGVIITLLGIVASNFKFRQSKIKF